LGLKKTALRKLKAVQARRKLPVWNLEIVAGQSQHEQDESQGSKTTADEARHQRKQDVGDHRAFLKTASDQFHHVVLDCVLMLHNDGAITNPICVVPPAKKRANRGELWQKDARGQEAGPRGQRNETRQVNPATFSCNLIPDP
ncbi:MAG: hypothetical protein ACREV2_13000, partial [Burkholderiales bacterium]